MTVSILCKDLGEDCHFVAEGETGDDVIELLMRHVHAVHGEDWFEIEEVYQAACRIVRGEAA